MQDNFRNPLGEESDSGLPRLVLHHGARSELSGPANEICSIDRANVTSVGSTANREASPWKALRKKKRRCNCLRKANACTSEVKARSSNNSGDAINTTGMGELVLDIVVDNPGGVFVHTPAQNEPDLAQGTTDRAGYATGPGPSRLVPAVVDSTPRSPIKVIQINAARSKSVMHQIENLLVTQKADVVLVQEPATDGSGIYLLDKHPLRAISAGQRPKAAVIVANRP